MRLIFMLTFSILFDFGLKSQVLFVGNSTQVCEDSTQHYERLDSIPKDLNKFKAVYIFSNAYSKLSKPSIDSLINYVHQGGGLYIGAENEPLQAESKQITRALYNKECFGTYNSKNADVTPVNSKLKLVDLDTLPAGKSTVAFPLDYRLQVEAWVDDQPLILSGQVNKGKIIIDGGYSRFYCENRDKNSDEIWRRILTYLVRED